MHVSTHSSKPTERVTHREPPRELWGRGDDHRLGEGPSMVTNAPLVARLSGAAGGPLPLPVTSPGSLYLLYADQLKGMTRSTLERCADHDWTRQETGEALPRPSNITSPKDEY